MVAITVILAAVIAAFVFGMGTPEKAPQTALKITADSAAHKITLYHSGGDPLVTADNKITIVYANDTSNYVKLNGTTDINGISLKTFLDYGNISTLTAGDTRSNTYVNNIGKGDIIDVKILNIPTGQFISSARVSVT